MTEQTRMPPAIDNESALLAYALELELEASERYAELAEQMDSHNNPEVAALFREMSRIEKLHADRILEQADGSKFPEPNARTYRWADPEGPETTDFGDAHYLLTPHHALKLALLNEQRAYAFFASVATKITNRDVSQLASEMAAEEQEHVALVEHWLARYPKPDSNWSYDPDPPVGVD